MPPERTGTVEPLKRANGKPYFRARIRLADGTRERVNVPDKYATPAGGMSARERAALYAQGVQEREDEGGPEGGPLLRARKARLATLAAKHDETNGETCEKYFDRFIAHRAAIGKVRRSRDLQGAWSTWISSHLGRKPIATITRDDVEEVRDALDAAVVERKTKGSPAGLSGARARNVWSVLTSMMKEASTSKRKDLRVRDDNPCTTVQPPDKTDPRAKTFIYPREFLALVGCEAVPREWRELYAVACYLYLRPGELRALAWGDVDFEAGVVHVTKAYDEDSETVKPPKTRNGVRDVPIPKTLVPLLEVMHKRNPDREAPVVPLMAAVSERRRAGWMRKHVALAGLDRARLTQEGPTTMQINFRSWRDTGITWLALAGVDVAKMQRRAGHDSLETTMGYVKAAEDLTGSIGEPFPALPASLLVVDVQPTVWAKSQETREKRGKSAERAGFESARDGQSRVIPLSSRSDSTSGVDASARSVDGAGPTEIGVVEALAEALVLAARAGEWIVVAALARELEARREGSPISDGTRGTGSI